MMEIGKKKMKKGKEEKIQISSGIKPSKNKTLEVVSYEKEMNNVRSSVNETDRNNGENTIADPSNSKKLKKKKRKFPHESSQESNTVQNDSTAGVKTESESSSFQELDDSKAFKKNKKKRSLIASSDNPSSPALQHVVLNIGNYTEHPSTHAMSKEDVESYRSNLNIEVFPEEDSKLYKPIISFEYLKPSFGDLCSEVQNYIQLKKFTTPSPIQVIHYIYIYKNEIIKM